MTAATKATKTGNLRPAFVGKCVTGAGGTFSCPFPAGLFTVAPTVTATIIGAGIMTNTAKSATAFTGSVLALTTLLGLASVEVDVVAWSNG